MSLLLSDALIPEMPAPPVLREKCEEMQAAAPYLGLGFEKRKLPAALHARLLEHFRENVRHFQNEGEIEEMGTVTKKSLTALVYEDKRFNLQLADELRAMHEQWAKTALSLSYCYGIRCYQRGAFLYNHVDRQPHFVSSSICVDHQLNSPWPLHIESVDGKVHQVNMEPGEYVLYEGARLAHGRPYPLDGDFYAGIFVHYYPAEGQGTST